MKLLIFAAISTIVIASFGCEPAVTTVAGYQGQSPPADTAYINIFDSGSERVFGCNEPSGVFIPLGTPLICTVPGNYSVTFFFAGTKLKHQIVPVGTPAIPVGSVSDPSADNPVLQSVFNGGGSPLSPGTYGFQDTYENQINGQLNFL